MPFLVIVPPEDEDTLTADNLIILWASVVMGCHRMFQLAEMLDSSKLRESYHELKSFANRLADLNVQIHRMGVKYS